MTFNEIFSAIGKNLDEIFYYLGNTPIEDLFISGGSFVLIIVIGFIIIGIIMFVVGICLSFFGILIEKIFPNPSNYEPVPLEKQSMYIMGKKMKNFFSKKNKRNKKK